MFDLFASKNVLRSIPCNWWLASYSSMVCIQMWSRPSMFCAGIFCWGGNSQKHVVGMDFLCSFWRGSDNMRIFGWWRGQGQVVEKTEKVLMISTCTIFHGEWCLANIHDLDLFFWWFSTFGHNKLPLNQNHHLGEEFLLVPSIFTSKSKHDVLATPGKASVFT